LSFHQGLGDGVQDLAANRNKRNPDRRIHYTPELEAEDSHLGIFPGLNPGGIGGPTGIVKILAGWTALEWAVAVRRGSLSRFSASLPRQRAASIFSRPATHSNFCT
jgi:hypothetical protein